MRLASEYPDFFFLTSLAHFHIDMSERLVISEEDMPQYWEVLFCFLMENVFWIFCTCRWWWMVDFFPCKKCPYFPILSLLE